MRTVKISDELFDELKSLVVDPFDDTPDTVIGRLIDIVKKAKSRWSPLDACESPEGIQVSVKPQGQPMHESISDPIPEATPEENEVVLL